MTLARRDLEAFWASLDLSDPHGAVRALEMFLPELIQSYGEVGAALSADFFEELRERSPAAAVAYRARLADAAPIGQVRGSLRWAAVPLFPRAVEAVGPDREAAWGRVLQMTDRLVKQPGRETIRANILRDPARPKYARVPTGAETCAYCVMMASRGAVYLGEASAGGAVNAKFKGAGIHKFHDHCDCVATPVWNNRLPEGYDPGAYYELYEKGLGVSSGA